MRAYRVVTHRCVQGVHCRLAQRRSEARFSEVVSHGFVQANRVTLRLSRLCEVNWDRGVVCDNPIST